MNVISAIAILGWGAGPAALASPAAECDVVAPAIGGCMQILSWEARTEAETLKLYYLPTVGQFQDDDNRAWSALFTPFCLGNVEGPRWKDDALCVGAKSTCSRYGSNAAVAMWMIATPLFPGEVPQLEGPLCFEGSTSVDLAPQIAALLEDEIGADPPPILLQPTNAIVNLPMIASTDIREPVVLTIDDPISGVAEATPEFQWSFADGAAAHGPGLPYDGTSPTANPGYYVSYTYGVLGTPTVDLTVTWRLTFTTAGNPPVPLDDVVREAAVTTTVRAAGSELIGG